MPASRNDRVIDLLERHVFAEQLLLMNALEAHAMRKCCTPSDQCTGAYVLAASMERIHRDTEAMIDELTTGRRGPAVGDEAGSPPE